jgi:translation initiation factor 3 subunit K
MTLFPSSQFDLALHLLPPTLLNPGANATSELGEAVTKLRALNAQLEGAQYARFWATMDSDDLYADLTTDIAGFEEMIRVRIAQLVGQAFRDIPVSLLEAWLGMDDEAEVKKFVIETCGWKVSAEGIAQVPKNIENEAKKAEIREDVSVDMFARVIRRSWEETA